MSKVKHELPLYFSEEAWEELEKLRENIVDKDGSQITRAEAIRLGLGFLKHFVNIKRKKGELLEEVPEKDTIASLKLPNEYKVVMP